ncbi:MAG TPA: hypothetical protein VK610_05330 [Rhodothermales bacterium]|nr:hypothetical protein [Rhodothermales bacterium]
MNARFFLLPFALLALTVAACDNGPEYIAVGLRASPTATRTLIDGPDTIQSCAVDYAYRGQTPSGAYFEIIAGASYATVNASTGEVTAVGTSGTVVLALKDSGGTTLDSRIIQIRPTRGCGDA